MSDEINDDGPILIMNGSATWTRDPKKGSTHITVNDGFRPFHSLNPTPR